MSFITKRQICSVLSLYHEINVVKYQQRNKVNVTDEHQPVTKPRSAIKGVELLRNPSLNKGTAFTLEERQHMGIHGLLPPAVVSQEIQALRVMTNLQRAQAIAGISPRHCLPIMLDVGTNNQISSNPLYIGLRQKRVIGKEYDEFINEFMQAVVQRFGWHCLIQFEDFASHNAHKLLEKYQKKYCTFNDDIQGTAAVVLAGLFAALRITGKKLIDNTYLFVGAGQAACGIADLITHAMIHEGSSIEEARSKIWMYDIHGLIVRNRPQGNIEGPKASYLKKGRAIKDLSSVIDYVKPTVLMGASGVARLFLDGVLKKRAQVNDRPIIFALSNPISRAECTAEEAYRETDKLGSLVTQKDLDSGRIYPPIPTIREVTIKIAAHLVEHLYKEKKAWFHPEPKDKEEFIRMQLYNTNYQYFGPLTWKWPELHKKPRNVPSMDDNIVLES
ncbi:unnamed protein product [Rotaria sp. Silwood2]|nr:unnamed protein product [Rotaria sp. Silwood2]